MATLTKRPDGRWQTQIRIGTNEKGRPQYRYLYAKTKADLQQKVNSVIAQIEGGTYADPHKITLGQWMAEWLEGRRPHIREATWQFYESLSRVHIIPALGKVQLNKITTRDIQRLLNEKLTAGRVTGGGLSPKTIKYIHVTIQAALKQAVRERLITVNPAEAVELPKDNPREMQTLSREQIGKLLDTARGGPFYMVLLLDLSTGLRRGELLGLQWQDIDFSKGTLTVKRQLTLGRGGIKLSEPKSKAGKRTITLPGEILQALKEHKRQQNETRLLMGEAYQNKDFVFATAEGDPISIHSLRHCFNKLLKEADLPEVRFHDLRHSYATLALGAGISPKVIQQILGHSQITVTLDTYAHVTREMQQEAADKMGDILKGVL